MQLHQPRSPCSQPLIGFSVSLGWGSCACSFHFCSKHRLSYRIKKECVIWRRQFDEIAQVQNTIVWTFILVFRTITQAPLPSSLFLTGRWLTPCWNGFVKRSKSTQSSVYKNKYSKLTIICAGFIQLRKGTKKIDGGQPSSQWPKGL